jgi:acyl-CoA thioester hydrolase
VEGFNHVFPIEVRFRDIDVLGHVNNAVTLTYLETARVPFLVAVGIRNPQAGLSDVSVIVAHLSCDFRKPIFFGQKVTVGSKIVKIGRTSLRLEHRIEADGELATEGVCILVHYDYTANRSLPLTPEMIARIEAFEGRKYTAGA